VGTWGKIVVLEGSLKYIILEPDIEKLQLDPQNPGIVEPAIKHQVEPQGKVKFYVEFYH
jgi:tellurite resistance-related uncharacterized protein